MALRDKSKAADIKQTTAVETPAPQKIKGQAVVAIEETTPAAEAPRHIGGIRKTITIGKFNHEVIIVDELPDADKAFISYTKEYDWGTYMIVNGRKIVKLAKGATIPGQARAIDRLGLGQRKDEPQS